MFSRRAVPMAASCESKPQAIKQLEIGWLLICCLSCRSVKNSFVLNYCFLSNQNFIYLFELFRSILNSMVGSGSEFTYAVHVLESQKCGSYLPVI